MMTTKKVSRAAKAKDIIDYLSEELGLGAAPEPSLAAYAGQEARGMAAYLGGQGPIRVGGAVSDDVARFLGIDRSAAPDPRTLENIISGKTASGHQEWLSPEATVAGFDYTFSADRSVSVAFALAQTPHERAAILGAHRQAVADVMREIAVEMGYTRRGKDGVETVEGDLAWFEFDHTASRPVPASALYADDPTAAGKDPDAILPGDPNLHTHTFLPNFVLARGADGAAHVGTMDSERLRGRVHEFGALYQARLAQHLQRLRIETEWDGAGAVRVTAIPDHIRDLFSKRAKAGEQSARRWAAEQGINFDGLDPVEQNKIMRASMGLDRHRKEGLQARFEDWAAQAEAAGYRHEGVIPSDDELAARQAPEPPSDDERLVKAVERADALAAGLFAKESVLTLQQLRVCCAQAAIGLFSRYEDIDRVQAALLDRGVTLDEERTEIAVGHLPLIDDTRPERDGVGEAGQAERKRTRGRNGSSLRGDETLITTQKHIDTELAVVERTRQGAADRTGAATAAEIAASVRRAETREKNPLSFKGEHGGAQLDGLNHLGQGGRIALLIGVAGSGKTTLMQPLVDTWTRKGMTVHGIAVAWRQANDLEGAGISAPDGEGKEASAKAKRRRGSKGGRSVDNGEEAAQEMRDAGVTGDRLHAVAAFIRRYELGQITVDADTVVLLDEVGQLGAKDARRLLEIQRRTNCHFKMIGDPLQCVSVEAGPTIDLLIRALGSENVPSVLTTIRQYADSEKANAALFRNGQAATVLKNKEQDGTARLVRGDGETFAAAAADRWAEMTDEAAAAGLTVGVTAPTNAQARLIGNAIRAKRRERGEITGEDRTVACTDSRGADAFDLALAVGDRVRLFRKIRGKRLDGRGGGMQLGVNGTIAEVRGFTEQGIILRGPGGVDCEVKWKTLTHKGTGRIQLNRGEVFTPDGSQGITRDLMLDTMPGGSDAMTAGKAYVTGSRHRIRHEVMVSGDAEREAILRERALGDASPINDEDVWARVAANLSRTGAKTSAMLLAERAQDLRRAAADLLLRHQIDRSSRLRRGQKPDTAFATKRQEEQAAQVALPTIEAAVQRAQEASAAVRETVRGLGASLTAGSGGEAPAAARTVVHAVTEAIRDAAPRIRAAVEAIRTRLGWRRGEIDPVPEVEGPRYG